VAYWKFNEGAGTTVADSIGTNTLTLSGNVAWASGMYGSSGCYTANQSLGSIVSQATCNLTSPFSVSIWLWFGPSTVTQGRAFTGVGSVNNLGNTPGWYLYYGGDDLSTPCYPLCSMWQGGTYHAVQPATKDIPSESWHHGVWVQGADSTCTYYLDGSTIMAKAFNYTPDPGGLIYFATRYGTGIPWTHETYVDEVCVWNNRALTQADVTEIYTKGHSLP
jgi:hypothetical protein